jgi:hypothetical protein
MAQTKDYINILMESLNKKSKILNILIGKNALQEKAIKDDNTSAFEKVVEEKAVLLQELVSLDEGFETVFERVKDDLAINRLKYDEQIRLMQNLIREITDKSMAIQASEQRNKQLIESHFKDSRLQLKDKRTSVKVASNYYKAMNRLSAPGSSQIDKKK